MTESQTVVTSPLTWEKPIPRVPITELLFKELNEHVSKNKDKDWVTDVVHDTRIKFGEVEIMSRKVASALTRMGFHKGSILYFTTREMAQLNIFILGSWICNGAVRGSSPDEIPERQAEILKECEADFALCDVETAPTMKEAIQLSGLQVQLVSLGEVEGATSLETLLEDDGSKCPRNTDIDVENDVIFLPTTSGSTGMPKGTMYTHLSMNAAVIPTCCTPPTSVLFTFSNFHVAGLTLSLHNLMKGISCYTVPVYTVENFLNGISKYKPHILAGFPFVMNIACKSPLADKVDLSSVQYVLCGGSALGKAMKQTLKDRFPNLKRTYNVFGMTEIDYVTSQYGEELLYGEEAFDEDSASCGVLYPGIQAMTIDINTSKPLLVGTKGQILLKGPSLMKGYFKKPKETKEAIDENGWLHSGDIGYIDHKGRLFVQDRMKEIFKYQAHHISPSEIEGVIQSHPAVTAAGVLGVPDPECTALPRAYVVKKPGHEISAKELEKYVEERVSDFKRLRGGVFFVDSLPMTKVGKLSRVDLQKYVINESGVK